MASNWPLRTSLSSRAYQALACRCATSSRTLRPTQVQRWTRAPSLKSLKDAHAYTTAALPSSLHQAAPSTPSTSRASSNSYDQGLRTATKILSSSTAVSEQEAQNALQICQNLAMKLAGPTTASGSKSKPGKGPTSNLLSIGHAAARSSPAPISQIAQKKAKLAERISKVAYDIAKDPKVFLTPKLLATYVQTQNTLGLPQSFPHVFDLYASKPIPKPGTSPIKCKEAKASWPTAAIPLNIAQDALTAALETQDLALCLSIIETSTATPAFRRAKFVRKALLPLTALAASPFAIYQVAWQLCQDAYLMDPQQLTNMATAGFIAYVGFTSIIGWVALSTANDQMDRITWVTGTPLRWRWNREEERAMIDRVAQAWGLEDRERRGNEEGEDWENLRDWVFDRSMYLDKPELLKGMQ